MNGRRLVLLLTVALAGAAAPASDAAAGAVVFSSNRCENAEDFERRREPFTAPPIASPGFVPYESCRRAIWRVGDDGSGLDRLTDGGEPYNDSDASPAWSPSGLQVVFAASRSASQGAFRLWLMNADGSGQRPLPMPAGGGFYSDDEPSWSPTGDRIAFTSTRTGFRDLFSVRPDGSGLVRLTHTGDRGEAAPTFTPEGGRILFTRLNAGGGIPVGEAPPPENGVFSVPAAGGAEERLTAGGVPVGRGLDFSPDGRHVAFSLFGYLWTMTAQGRDLRQRTGVPGVAAFGLGDMSPTWAGLGSTMIFSSEVVRDRRDERRRVLHRLDLAQDGADRRPITHPFSPYGSTPTGDAEPDWHPLALQPPLLPTRDNVAPAVRLFDASGHRPAATRRAGAAATAARARSVRRGALRFLAIDRSGIRRLEAAIHVRSGRRCRFAGRRGLGRRRSCSRPAYFRATPEAWRRRIAKLRPGTYGIRLRGTDSKRNRPRRPRPVYIRLRR